MLNRGMVVRTVLTYGTFDMLHFGHIEYLRKAKTLGDYLIVGLKTDKTALRHGKKTYYNYDIRKRMIESLKYVDLIIEYDKVAQKKEDIKKYKVDILVVSEGSKGNNKELAAFCEVAHYDRTPEISTTKLKQDIKVYKTNEEAPID
jgi:glycerol-3-phosphate cytidylyltransferase